MKHSLRKCAPFVRAAFVFRLEQTEFDECATGPLDTLMENCHQPGARRRFDMACGVIDKRAARAGESNRSRGLMEHPRIGLCQPDIGRVDDRIEGVCETGRGKIVGEACRSVREQRDGTRAADFSKKLKHGSVYGGPNG